MYHSRFTHAPGHLRDRFDELVEAGDLSNRELYELAGQLLNCSDQLPGFMLGYLEGTLDPKELGWCYGAASRAIRRRVQSA